MNKEISQQYIYVDIDKSIIAPIDLTTLKFINAIQQIVYINYETYRMYCLNSEIPLTKNHVGVIHHNETCCRVLDHLPEDVGLQYWFSDDCKLKRYTLKPSRSLVYFLIYLNFTKDMINGVKLSYGEFDTIIDLGSVNVFKVNFCKEGV